jgi:hypothetical protein
MCFPGVDYRVAEEGGDGRPVGGMFCHVVAAVLYPLYLLFGMLAQLATGAFEPGPVLSIAMPKRWEFEKIEGSTLTFKKSTSTLPSIPLFEVDNGHVSTKDIFGRL